jgi:hypothetical protein
LFSLFNYFLIYFSNRTCGSSQIESHFYVLLQRFKRVDLSRSRFSIQRINSQEPASVLPFSLISLDLSSCRLFSHYSADYTAASVLLKTSICERLNPLVYDSINKTTFDVEVVEINWPYLFEVVVESGRDSFASLLYNITEHSNLQELDLRHTTFSSLEKVVLLGSILFVLRGLKHCKNVPSCIVFKLCRPLSPTDLNAVNSFCMLCRLESLLLNCDEQLLWL